MFGKDKTFSGGKSSKLRFVIAKGKENEVSVSYGRTAELTGSLTGALSANHPLALQATAYPFKGAFLPLGGSIRSDRFGRFVFKVAHLTTSTEFRVVTVESRPLFSPVIQVHVSPRIVLHVRSSGGSGLYRLYGTVTPARTGAAVIVQQLKPQKPGSKRSGPAPHSIGTTVLKHATSSMSRFSIVVSLSGNFHYRVYVRLPKGPLVSGVSSNVLIRAPKATGKGKHKKKK